MLYKYTPDEYQNMHMQYVAGILRFAEWHAYCLQYLVKMNKKD